MKINTVKVSDNYQQNWHSFFPVLMYESYDDHIHFVPMIYPNLTK